MHKQPKITTLPALKPLAAAALLASASQASAFQFDTSSDWNIRWDNTVKFNYMVRAEDQKRRMLSDSSASLVDDSNLGWDKWDTVSTRFDLLSELDVIWKDKLGFRISGAGWYDFAYDESNHPGSNPYLGGANTWGGLSYRPPGFGDDTRKYHEEGGELLDAFVFYNFEAGDVAGNVRAGRHTIFWGNSLLLTGAVHGVAGSMVAIDAAKGFSVPGSEAQELFLPSNKISTVLQLTPNLTFNAYYSLEYEEVRLPQDGSFLSPAEILVDDASEFLVLAPGFGWPGDPGFIPRIGQVKIDDEKPDDEGDWGVNFQYYFNNLDFEAQFFYLNYSSKIQDGLVGTLNFGPAVATFGGAGVPPFDAFYPTFASAPDLLEGGALGIGEFNLAYKDDIDLFGFAVMKEIAGMSVGLEYVYRHNTPLRVELGTTIQRIAEIPDPLKPVLEAAAGITEFDIYAADTNSNYPNPVGDTQHLIINTLGLLNGSALWDGGSFVAELVLSWVSDIDKNGYEQYFLHSASKHDMSAGISLAFNPEYYQVFSGTDLKLPMSISYTLDTGDEPAIGLGGNPGVGNASIGAEFIYQQVWTAGVRYNAFFGSHDNGFTGFLTDRDNISFTVKRTF